MSLFRRCWNWLKANWTWLRWPVTVLILGWLFYRHRAAFSQVQERPLQWDLLLLAGVMSTVSLLLTHYRWHLLVSAHHIPFRFRDAVRLGFLGYLFNYVAPGGGGGDLVKALLIAREHPERKTTVISSILLDRILGMVALLLTAALACMLLGTVLSETREFQPILMSYVTGAVAGILGVILMMVPWITQSRWMQSLRTARWGGKLITELLDDVEVYQQRLWILPVCIAVSLLGHLLMLSSFFVIGLAMFSQAEVPGWAEHLQFMPAAQLVGVAVPLPGGIGAIEEAAAWFYQLCGAEAANGFLVIILFRVLMLIAAALGASGNLLHRKEIAEAMHEAEETSLEEVLTPHTSVPHSVPTPPP